MNQRAVDHPRKPFFRRRGAGILITGFLLAALFGANITVGKDPGEGLNNPVWIGVFFGVLIMGYGLYRAIKGSGMLDYPQGGTNNEPE